ncbi:hypothetical protein BDBG_01135 [Blastomyces gilchristii SLH14081]|uniref:Uncharacterized protein n=1 Tax=Blastomyces gilchristii (strain SLH14081) TaxID=559298 RepID=A0A179UDM9_BLAGS|nr:uncharacterized protein BDBG_01135 [Blastomyces gilchristii SLH14081]OAT04612.1 hypothetical protein BDBG_01135 [Blastomyces gilchristii SLH14081]
MAPCSHNKRPRSAHTGQFVSREIVMGFAVHEVMVSTDTKKLFMTVKFNIAGTSTLCFSDDMTLKID